MKLTVRRFFLPLALLLALGLPVSSAGAQTLGDVGAAMEAGAAIDGGNAQGAANAANENGGGEDSFGEETPQEEPEETPGEGDSGEEDGQEAATDEGGASDDGDIARSRAEGMKDKWGDQHEIYRDPHPFVSWWKLLLVLLMFFFWVKTCDWVNYASQMYELGYVKWNGIVVACGVAGLALVVIVPFFMVTMPLYLLLVIVPFSVFTVVHNKAVESHQKVFTGDWWRHTMASIGNKFGGKFDLETKADYEKGPPVDLIAKGAADDRGNQANLMTARLSPGYVLVKELISDMTAMRSDRLILDYTADAVAIRHYIDGVWTPGEPRDRESGDVMLAVIKQLSNLNVKERTKKQAGEFAAKFNGADFRCPIVTQGVKSGERVMLSLQSSNAKQLHTYAELGMRDKLAEQWAEALIQPSGLVLISAMPDGGLSTLTNVSLKETDRLMRDVFSIDPKGSKEGEIENVVPNYYDPAAGETPATIMPSLVRRYPDAYVVRDFVDEESAKLLIDQAKDDKLVITTTRAKEAAEAMLRVLQKKAPRQEFAQSVYAVINTRLIRKLCTDCKVGYEASPELLKKLGIPPGKVQQLFRPPTEEDNQKPCEKCAGSGYFGRTGLFELLIVNDQVQEALLKTPKLDAVRRAARAAGMRTLQEEGVLLVAKGTTSLQELQRILKQ